MRAVKWVILLFFVVSVTGLMQASIDPRIEISDPACQEGDQTVEGLGFTFGALPAVQHFCNGSGQNWTSLTISFDATGITGNDIVCGGFAFNRCDIYQDGVLVNSFCPGCDTERPAFNGFSNLTDPADDPHFDIYFVANDSFPGIGNGHQFTIDLGCHDVNGCQPFDPNTVFTGLANAPAPSVPEPATLVLLAGAGIPQLLRRIRRK